MASDSLRLLFELDVDSRSGTAGLLRFRKDIAATIEAARRAITQPLKTLNTASVTAATAKVSVSTQELANRQARATQAAQRLQIGQQRLAVSATQLTAAQQRAATAIQRAANSQTQAAAGAIRAATSYQRATTAANNFTQSQNAVRRALQSVQSGLRGIGQGLQSAGRALTVGITAPLLALGAASLKSAKDLDANVNTLKAFTGSAEAAERRLAQLIKTSRATPGLTTNLALTLDAQLRVAQTTQETIDRVLPAIGRLNAVSKLPDAARFTNNLLQLVTQNFERQDLKELVGQSPLAGQLLTEIFNVDSPTNAKAIRESAKKLGLTTVDAFFNAFAEAAARNQGLATVTESIGTRFDKLVDRITVALRPLGLAIINAIEPFIEPVARVIERIGAAFDSLSAPVKTAIIVIAGVAAAAGPVLFVLGGIATAVSSVVAVLGTVGAAVAAIGLPALAAVIAGLVIVIGEWVAILGVLGLAWKTNFLGIRELVSNAASAVVEALGRIKAIITEATERILPTLQSITTKVVGAITLLWERHGKAFVAIISTAFRIATSIVETFLKTFADFVDLVLKLIDGNWQGAWSAFARIVIRALQGLEFALSKLPAIVLAAFLRLNQIIVTQAVRFAFAGEQLAVKLVVAIAAKLVKSGPAIRDALVEMLTLAVSGLDPTSVAAVMVGKFVAALKKAAAEGVTVPVAIEPRGLARIRLNPDGSLKTDKKPPPPRDPDKVKGADTETRRRIRLLELEAERAEAIARQGIAAENILFDQRRTSLQEFTDFQIRQEELVLKKKKEVFAAERVEAEKLGKGRDLALGEIRLKELKAELDFADRKNQILANHDKEELEAAKAHRQALLDIQEQADVAELARLEDFQKQGHVTAFDVANRRAEIEAKAFARRKAELELQQVEAGKNLEEQQRIADELNKLNDDAAESVRRNERLKREAIQETADAYRDYTLAINEALEVAADARRNAAVVALSRLTARVFLTERQRIERRFAIDRSLLEAEKRASDLRIDNAEREAIEKAKKSGELEEKLLQIQKAFNALRIAEKKRFIQEEKKLDEDKKADLERTDPASGRSLFGDVFADTASATGSILQSLLATGQDVFAQLSAQAGNMRDVLVNVFSSIGQAVGDAAQAFVLYGNSGTSFKKVSAQIIASVVSMAAVKAIFELAEGFAALARGIFGNPKGFAEAALHFKSAAVYGLVAGAAALAGRAVAGNSFNDKQGTASAAVNGGEPEPRNRDFQNGPQAAVESSSQAAREGSGGLFGGVIARIEGLQQQTLEVQRQQMLLQGQTAQALGRIQSMRHGDALAIGAAENPAAVGQAVINHSNSDGQFNEDMQRNLGFAR